MQFHFTPKHGSLPKKGNYDSMIGVNKLLDQFQIENYGTAILLPSSHQRDVSPLSGSFVST